MKCLVYNCGNEANGVEFEYWYPTEIRRGRVCGGHDFLIVDGYKHYTIDEPRRM